MNELFKMNDHGDIWQEPTLFDTPEPVEISREVFDTHRAAVEDNASANAGTCLGCEQFRERGRLDYCADCFADLLDEIVRTTTAPDIEAEYVRCGGELRQIVEASGLPVRRTRAQIRDYVRNGPRSS